MIKSEKGITMVMLIITVIVLVILAGIGLSAGRNLLKKSELEDRVAQMQMIQAKVEEVYNEHLYNGTELLGTEVNIDSDGSPDTEIEKWYKLSRDDMNKIGIDFKPTDKFYYCVKYDLTQEENKEGVNKEEIDPIDIYYSAGYKSTSGKTYYTLSKLKDLES